METVERLICTMSLSWHLGPVAVAALLILLMFVTWIIVFNYSKMLFANATVRHYTQIWFIALSCTFSFTLLFIGAYKGNTNLIRSFVLNKLLLSESCGNQVEQLILLLSIVVLGYLILSTGMILINKIFRTQIVGGIIQKITLLFNWLIMAPIFSLLMSIMFLSNESPEMKWLLFVPLIWFIFGRNKDFIRDETTRRGSKITFAKTVIFFISYIIFFFILLGPIMLGMEMAYHRDSSVPMIFFGISNVIFLAIIFFVFKKWK